MTGIHTKPAPKNETSIKTTPHNIFKWVTLFGFIFILGVISLTVYSAHKTGVGVCVPDEIQNQATNSIGVTAAIHVCGEALGYYYYLDISPGSLTERKVEFSDSANPPEIIPPKVEWVDDNTLKIIEPKWMRTIGKKPKFIGIQLLYEEAP